MLTQAELQALLSYNPGTGVFTRIKACRGHAVGELVGSFTDQGYWRICVLGRTYMAHRLAWFYVFGMWPVGDVDHIDHDICNNRIANLRDISHAHNVQHQITANARTQTGKLGVTFCPDKKRKRYKAQVTINQRAKCIGYYLTAEEAHEAYVLAKRAVHPYTTL